MITNWNRKCDFGLTPCPDEPYEIKTLRPPRGHYIKGFYLRMGPLHVQSFGAIYAAGSSGCVCPSIPPLLSIDQVYETSVQGSWRIFESYARLRGIQKIWFYYESDRCTGLRLFYVFGYSEVVGRIRGQYSRELLLPQNEPIERSFVLYEGEKLKNIEFNPRAENFQGTGELYMLTEDMVCG